MGIEYMEEDELLEDFIDHPYGENHKVDIQNVRVGIFHKIIPFPNLGPRDIYVTMHLYPYKDFEGGLIVISNPIAFVGTKRKFYESTKKLHTVFSMIKKKTLGPGVTLIWDGPMLRDSPSTIRKVQ